MSLQGYLRGESICPEISLCGSKNKCARTDSVFLPLSEVSEGTVYLAELVVTVFVGHPWQVVKTDFRSENMKQQLLATEFL